MTLYQNINQYKKMISPRSEGIEMIRNGKLTRIDLVFTKDIRSSLMSDAYVATRKDFVLSLS